MTSYRLYQTLSSRSFFMVLRSGPSQRLSSVCWNGPTGISFALFRVSLHAATHHPLITCLGVTESMILQRKLNFVNSIISLDNNSLPKKLLIKRTRDPLAKGVIPDLQTTLDHLNFPSINILLDNPVKPTSWKRSNYQEATWCQILPQIS